MTKYIETPNGDLRRSLPELRTVVDHGCAKNHAGKRGPGFRAEKWGGRWWIGFEDADAKLKKASRAAQLEVANHPQYGECFEAEFLRAKKGRTYGELHRFRDGSTEWEIVWDTREQIPEYVDFLIDCPDGLTWAHQPPLTQEEIDQGCERPENVVNSYAVYAPVSGRYLSAGGEERQNYETGKLMHVYRSWLADSRGNRVWLDQTAPLGDPPRLRITIPPEIVAAMVPPITCGPTFGYEAIGASYLSFSSSIIHGTGSFLPLSAGVLTALTFYNKNTVSGIAYRLGLYTDAAGPATLVATSMDGTISGLGWQTVNAAATVPIALYWLVAAAATTSARIAYDTAIAANRRATWSFASGVLPDPYPAVTVVGNRLLSIYATYTETPSGHVPHSHILRSHRLGA